MCKVIIKKIFGPWFHQITHICNIHFLNPASLANQEMLISTMFLVWYGSKTFSVHLAIMFWVKGIILSYFYYLQGWRNDRHDKLCRSFYKPNCETRGF